MTTDMTEMHRPYDPNRLLDALKEMLHLDSDVALSQALELPLPIIGQIRHRGYPVAPSILIRMHEVSTLSIRELRKISGDRRRKVRTGYDESFQSYTITENGGFILNGETSHRYSYLIFAAAILGGVCYLTW